MTNKLIYIRLDGDNIGDRIELYLLNEDSVSAQLTHDQVQHGIRKVKEKIQTIERSNILLHGCDDILFSMEEEMYKEEILTELQTIFKTHSKFTLSIGVGRSLKESNENLRRAKLSGKDRVVVM